MIRSPMVLVAAVTLALAGTAAVVAQAEPAPPPCAYTLSPPHVVQLSGTNVVTATLSPAACMQLQGSDGPGQCMQQNGILTAQVFYQPYRPGATYVSTGRGCADTGNPPQPVCQPIGPLTATL
jgi:hypothetical protein